MPALLCGDVDICGPDGFQCVYSVCDRVTVGELAKPFHVVFSESSQVLVVSSVCFTRLSVLTRQHAVILRIATSTNSTETKLFASDFYPLPKDVCESVG